MLKAGKLSEVLGSVCSYVSKSRTIPDRVADSLTIMLVTGDGQLLSSSVPNDSANFDSVQRIGAVVASMATEYRAIDKIMQNEFRSFMWSCGGRLIRCSHFCDLKDKGSVLMVISLSQPDDTQKAKFHSFLHAVAARLEEDLLPSLAPIMECMISAPPVE